jgi:hypothetical protein
MTEDKFKGPADNESIALMHQALTLLEEVIEIYKNKKYNLLSIFKHLKSKTAYYDGEVYEFFDFIKIAKKDTKGGYFKKPKASTKSVLRNILVNILIAIRSIRHEQSKELKKFIEEEIGYDIVTNSQTLNLLNFFLNFRIYDNFDTVYFVNKIIPGLIENSRVTKKVFDLVTKLQLQEGGGRKTKRKERSFNKTRSNRSNKK